MRAGEPPLAAGCSARRPRETEYTSREEPRAGRGGSGERRVPASDLPTGTVTFLFTDIEGSTAPLGAPSRRDEGGAGPPRRVAAPAIARARRRVFKTVGDAFCAAFATRARSGRGGAGRRAGALHAEPWDEQIGPLRVRMALHTGAAEGGDGDYFGPP